MTHTDADLRRYLLGQSSTAESEAIEAAYFADHAITARLDDLADDLMRAHLAGTLNPSDRAAFERLPETPARAARTLLVQRFDRRANSHRSTSSVRVALWPMLAIAATVTMAVGTWWTTRSASTPPEPRQVEVPPAGSTAVAPSLTRPPVIVALTLPVTATRSGGLTPTVNVSADVTVVALRLTQALAPLASLTAEIRGVDAPIEWRGLVASPGAGAPEATAGEVLVPGGELPAGDYILTIRRANEIVSRAFFRVVRP
jgi:hypothetical protein